MEVFLVGCAKEMVGVKMLFFYSVTLFKGKECGIEMCLHC